MNLEYVNCFYRHGGIVVTSTGENILNLVLMKLNVSSSIFSSVSFCHRYFATVLLDEYNTFRIVRSFWKIDYSIIV